MENIIKRLIFNENGHKKTDITSCYTYNNPFCIQIFYKLPTKSGKTGSTIP